jgi:hypothetical protein
MVIMELCHEVRELAQRRLPPMTLCAYICVLIVSLFKVKTVIMLEEHFISSGSTTKVWALDRSSSLLQIKMNFDKTFFRNTGQSLD